MNPVDVCIKTGTCENQWTFHPVSSLPRPACRRDTCRRVTVYIRARALSEGTMKSVACRSTESVVWQFILFVCRETTLFPIVHSIYLQTSRKFLLTTKTWQRPGGLDLDSRSWWGQLDSCTRQWFIKKPVYITQPRSSITKYLPRRVHHLHTIVFLTPPSIYDDSSRVLVT